MSTIKELAETCGVSEQAIRKWGVRETKLRKMLRNVIS